MWVFDGEDWVQDGAGTKAPGWSRDSFELDFDRTPALQIIEIIPRIEELKPLPEPVTPVTERSTVRPRHSNDREGH